MSKIYYAFTVKDNNKEKMPMPSDYEDWIMNANSKGFRVECYYYELDSKGRLHIHGCAIANKNFYKKQLLYNGFHQKIDPIPTFIDLQNWSDYIQKDYINQHEYNEMIHTYVYTHSQDSPFI